LLLLLLLLSTNEQQDDVDVLINSSANLDNTGLLKWSLTLHAAVPLSMMRYSVLALVMWSLAVKELQVRLGLTVSAGDGPTTDVLVLTKCSLMLGLALKVDRTLLSM